MKIKRVCAAIAAALLVSTVGFSLSGCGDPLDVYVKARADFSEGLYSEAGAKFISLGDYRDSKEMIVESYNLSSHRYGSYCSFTSLDITNWHNSMVYRDSNYDLYDLFFSYDGEPPTQRIKYYRCASSSKLDPLFEMTVPYKITNDGYLDIMGGYSKYFKDFLPTDANEKENMRLIVYKTYLIEQRAVFNGVIPKTKSEQDPFDAEFYRGDERYTFKSDGTFSYTGEYAGNSGMQIGEYHREGDYIILNYHGITRGLLIYKDTIVDRGAF